MLTFRRTLPLLSQEAYRTADLREEYTNVGGDLDFGKLLAYLDINTGEVAQRQAGIPVMTVAMEGVSVREPLTLDMDYDFLLRVTKTWNSSLEIGVEVYGNDGQGSNRLVDFYFTFVGVRDGCATPIAGDSPGTPEEVALAEDAEHRKQAYIASAKTPLQLRDILRTERDALESIPCSAVPTALTEKIILDPMCPRDQNRHGTIFGGRLLERTYDVAWTAAYDFLEEGVPLIAAVNRVNFKHPVNIGDIVRYETRTAYTHKTSLVQEVVVTAENPSTRERRLTNTCTYTFVKSKPGTREKLPLSRHVRPETDEEILAWIAADRRRVSR